MGLVPAASAGSLRQTRSSAPDVGGHAVAKLQHLAELVTGVDVQQGERDGSWEKRFLREPQHDGGVLADAVEHDGPLELGGHLPQDVNAFRFKKLKVSQRCCRHQGNSRQSVRRAALRCRSAKVMWEESRRSEHAVRLGVVRTTTAKLTGGLHTLHQE